MKRYALFIVMILLVACSSNGANGEGLSHVEEATQKYDVREELRKDTKQVFQVLEQAHKEDRRLNDTEKILLHEYEDKYDGVELNEREAMIFYTLMLLSTGTKERAMLETDKGFYEETREFLLQYIDLSTE